MSAKTKQSRVDRRRDAVDAWRAALSRELSAEQIASADAIEIEYHVWRSVDSDACCDSRRIADIERITACADRFPGSSVRISRLAADLLSLKLSLDAERICLASESAVLMAHLASDSVVVSVTLRNEWKRGKSFARPVAYRRWWRIRSESGNDASVVRWSLLAEGK